MNDPGDPLNELGYLRDDPEYLFMQYNNHWNDSLTSAIYRGHLFIKMQPITADRFHAKTGRSIKTAYKEKDLVINTRMFRTDWVKPQAWKTVSDLITLSDGCFDAMLAEGHVHANTTQSMVDDFRRAWMERNLNREVETTITTETPIFNPHLNKIVHGDCIEKMLELPDYCIHLAIFSPPYAMQRQKHYKSAKPEDYPDWFVSVMNVLKHKLTANGSVLIVIRAHDNHGKVNPYLLKTRLDLQEKGLLYENFEFIWDKPDGPHNGNNDRPRKTWEHVLWLSRTENPYIDVMALGKFSHRIGHDNNNLRDGTAIMTDRFTVSVCMNEVGKNHPAPFPEELVRQLLLVFSKEGDTILDMFAGSGTTGVVAQGEKRNFVMIENELKYVEYARGRLLLPYKRMKSSGVDE